MFEPGSIVAGWEIDALIHQGSMASTFMVHKGNDNRPHAMKLLFLRDPNFQERLRRAASVLIAIRHPNLVPVVEVVEFEGMQGIVSTFIDGTELASWSAQEQRPLSSVMRVFRQLTQGLKAAHDHGLVHRNLKPAKVLIDLTGRPHIHDFMLGKVVSTDPQKAVTQLGTTFGTPQYMAPEQFRGAAGVDERADIFSLGCLLFEMVAGRRAFEGKGLMEIYKRVSASERDALTSLRDDVPEELEVLVADLTNPDAGLRPQTTKDIIARIDSEPMLRKLINPSFSTATPVSALTSRHPSSAPEASPPDETPPAQVSRSHSGLHRSLPSVPIFTDDEKIALSIPPEAPTPLSVGKFPTGDPSHPSIIEFTQFDSAEPAPLRNEPPPAAPPPQPVSTPPFHNPPPAKIVYPWMQIGIAMVVVFALAMAIGMALSSYLM